jgi:uncharacterized protein YqjF (DUF2071 family)
MTWMQQWLDCLFLHFPVPAAAVQRHVPPRLEVETFAGSAWISYVLFRLKLRPAWLPGVPSLSSLVELNIRTYVRHRGHSGIYFLRVLADNHLSIAAARMLTPMPYEHAAIIYDSQSVRCRHSAQPQNRLALQFTPPRCFSRIPPGTLEAWLLERYRLFVGGRNSSVLAADAEHPPWQAAPLTTAVHENSLAADFDLGLGAHPAAAHYSPGVAAQFHTFHTVAAQRVNPCQSREPLRAPAVSRCLQPSRGD